MGRVLLLVVLAGGLAACSHNPSIVDPAPPGISYRYQGDDVASANERAEQYCQQYGKHSHLQTTNRSGTDNIAVYECR
jgi:putative hemolysin